MATTRIADVIVPEVFMRYVIERTTQKSRIIRSGIASTSPEWDAKANAEGRTQNMPFWDDLDGDDTVVKGDGTELTPGKLSTNSDVCTKVIREKAWSYNDLVKHLTAEDPAAAIADMVANYRVRRIQAQLLSTLKGIFASGTLNSNILDLFQPSGTVDSSHLLTGKTMIQAAQKLGDAKDTLTAIVMHSAVEAQLEELDLIDYIPASQGGGLIRTFQGKEVIIDDDCPTETVDSKLVYHSFLFGKGAIALGNGRGNDPIDNGHGTWETEFVREGLKGDSTAIFRWKNIMHPRGVKFADAAVVDHTPSNLELEDATNWARVYDPKNIRIVRIKSNILG